MTEIWKTIENYETYSVSTFGNIRNDLTGKILKGAIHRQGYIRIRFNRSGPDFYVHRLVANAFILNIENYECVDHIDNITSNNNLKNLRWCSRQQNMFNSKLRSTTTTGIKGVYFHIQKQKWEAKIQINKKLINIGSYDTIEEAILARQTKANELFGSFTNSCEKH